MENKSEMQKLIDEFEEKFCKSGLVDSFAEKVYKHGFYDGYEQGHNIGYTEGYAHGKKVTEMHPHRNYKQGLAGAWQSLRERTFMNILFLLLILSNFVFGAAVISLKDVVQRNEAMADTDRMRNTSRFDEVKSDIKRLERAING